MLVLNQLMIKLSNQTILYSILKPAPDPRFRVWASFVSRKHNVQKQIFSKVTSNYVYRGGVGGGKEFGTRGE